MITLNNVKISNALAKTMENDLQVHETIPYGFILHDKVTEGIHFHTANKIEKITKWANSYGATVKASHKEYGNVVLIISDPVAVQLEKFLKEFE